MNGIPSHERLRIQSLIKSGRTSRRYKDGTLITLEWGNPAERSYGFRILYPYGPWKDVTIKPAPK